MICICSCKNSADLFLRHSFPFTPAVHILQVFFNFFLVLARGDLRYQFMLRGEQLGDAIPYMKDGMTVDRTTYQGETIGVELPVTVDLKVTATEPGFAGDTAQGAKKAATLESGLVLQVPLFVNEGDTVRVDTRTGEYQTRL